MAPWVLFAAGFLLAAIGFVGNAMWRQIPWSPAALLAGLALVSLLLAYGLARLFQCQAATSAAAVWLGALVYFAGISPFASVLLITVAALAIGSVLVPKGWDARVPLSVLAGLALLCGIVGWLLPFPLHGHAVYTLALLAVIILRRRAVLDMVAPLSRSWTAAVAGSPWAALLGVLVLGLVSTCAWVPTIHYDDLAYHLGLPYQLETLGYYRMDAGSRVWAVSAWAGDVLQGMAQVVAGGESRGPVDVLWLMLTVTMMWKLCEALQLSPRTRWLAVAIYASMPMTAGTLTGMQTEGATAAAAVGVALLIQRTMIPGRRELLLVALLLGLLLGLKVSNLMVAGPLGLWLLWQWRAKLPWRTLPQAVVLALFVGGSSYFYAYLLTGNPVLPLFNGFFHSTYYNASNFHDATWDTGFHWSLPWDLTFHTSRFIEGSDGAGGFTLLALLGGLLLAVTRRNLRPLALMASLVFLLPLTQIQYLRYAHPAMALLVPAMLGGLPAADQSRRQARVLALMLVGLVLGNLLFVANGDWQLRQGVLRNVLVQGRASTTDTYAPIRRLAAFIRDRYGAQARALIIDGQNPFAAELAGNAFVINWYDQELSAMAAGADGDPSGERWSGLFKHTGANLLVVNKVGHTQALDAAIDKAQGARVYELGDLELWTLHSGVAGIEVPAPAHAVVVKFDSSSTPAGATVVSADLDLKCKAANVPIVISWDVTEADGQHWQRAEWARCLQTGKAEASLEVPLLSKVTGFSVNAAPSQPVDLQLQLTTATAAFRPDLAADRDLALRLRSDLIGTVKMWNKARRAARKAKP
ncbi:hypothetical protein [Rhodanobacter sp. B04]|uniref:hypothetical protein n=1 Tax=Rhodanobacter sp. B04 TaxID=1945860 RepID=UPI0011155F5E|nr:hypothetical protein [Rhodanobacter sp. B04]